MEDDLTLVFTAQRDTEEGPATLNVYRDERGLSFEVMVGGYRSVCEWYTEMTLEQIQAWFAE